jgi:hypothetical protein
VRVAQGKPAYHGGSVPKYERGKGVSGPAIGLGAREPGRGTATSAAAPSDRARARDAVEAQVREPSSARLERIVRAATGRREIEGDSSRERGRGGRVCRPSHPLRRDA